MQGKQFVEVAAVELDSSGPIEVVEGNAFFEACGDQSPFEGQGVTALHLVGEDQGKEGGVVELLGTRQCEPVGQGGDDLSQFEPLEEGDEVWLEAHTVTSRRRWSKALPGRAKRPASGGPSVAGCGVSASRAWRRMRWRRRTSISS